MEKPILRMPKNNEFDGLYAGNILGSREKIEKGLKEARKKIEESEQTLNLDIRPFGINVYKGLPVFCFQITLFGFEIKFFDEGLEIFSKDIKKSKEEIINIISSEYQKAFFKNRIK